MGFIDVNELSTIQPTDMKGVVCLDSSGNVKLVNPIGSFSHTQQTAINNINSSLTALTTDVSEIMGILTADTDTSAKPFDLDQTYYSDTALLHPVGFTGNKVTFTADITYDGLFIYPTWTPTTYATSTESGKKYPVGGASGTLWDATAAASMVMNSISVPLIFKDENIRASQERIRMGFAGDDSSDDRLYHMYFDLIFSNTTNGSSRSAFGFELVATCEDREYTDSGVTSTIIDASSVYPIIVPQITRYGRWNMYAG